jgi:formate hydrogenlyase subunit 3/multisubunit Na+/H+ antiporter MnhD subunit
VSAWLALVPVLPLVVALLAASRRGRGWIGWLAPLALLPALAVVLWIPPGTSLTLDWLLLGTYLGLDATGRIFLLFSALAWLMAALYARVWLAADPRRARFFGFFLAAAAGNLGVCLAQDVISFYFFFALMTFSAWGLVLHRATPAARRAGTVYIVLAVLGEAALLAALWLIVAEGGALLAQAPVTVADSPRRAAIVALLLTGFGVKTGVLGLHVSLPLAYGATPAPGAAVLASAMIKAGLLGWLRFLPLGFAAPEWSAVFIALGLAAAFYGVVIGLVQREPKVILAYSSISQMGLITIGVGLGMTSPTAGAPVLFALTLYALHHALVKGALFLGEGLHRATRGRARGWVFAGLALLAASLAGAPLTSGMLAKHYLKGLALSVPWPLVPALTLAGIGTTLLMARFLWQLWYAPADVVLPRARGLVLPWVVMIVAVLAAAWLVLPLDRAALLAPGALGGAAWPVVLGVLAAAVAWRFVRARRFTIPPGDVLVPVERALRWTAELARRAPRISAMVAGPVPGTDPSAVVARLEPWLRSWSAVGVALLALLGLFVVLLALG